MEQSILKSTKEILGIQPDYDAFDLTILTHINSVFVTLNDLGIGPPDGFEITDATAVWDEYLNYSPNQNSIKSYIFLRVRLLFDPPVTSFHLESMEKQIKELEWRINTRREDAEWVEPPPQNPTAYDYLEPREGGIW